MTRTLQYLTVLCTLYLTAVTAAPGLIRPITCLKSTADSCINKSGGCCPVYDCHGRETGECYGECVDWKCTQQAFN
ncbi:hypothetical protein EJ03DRAFT_85319 [Teratosphaeria nubilosa]|uniref:Uncharacterized protein n=1 Tax=Teratosphaeria nubilosa TaxID=161662 RepID=A0A6G1LCB9_9PEZI|nr:hypothetical protein EJ03DRAFT_85319 [Teratosphaeria nubilosa]